MIVKQKYHGFEATAIFSHGGKLTIFKTDLEKPHSYLLVMNKRKQKIINNNIRRLLIRSFVKILTLHGMK